MEVSSKQDGAAYSGRDRLSDLSDCILHTILSHLKALQVVQTSLLSRRWRHLWRSAPSADIDCRELRIHSWRQQRPNPPLDGLSENEIAKVNFGRFEDIVDSLLLHHGARLLHTLRLRIEDDMSEQTARCLPRWIRRALGCAPVVLAIHYGASIVLPPRSPGTRRLTKLCLVQVSLHGGFAKQIATELPVLEDLRFKNSDLSSLSRIKSDTLKSLTIDCCHKTPSSVYPNLVIDAPRLASLHLSIMFHTRATFTLAEAPSLVQASICLVKRPRKKPRNWKPNSTLDKYILKDLSQLLRSLFNSNVSILKLAGFQKMVRPFFLFISVDQINNCTINLILSVYTLTGVCNADGRRGTFYASCAKYGRDCSGVLYTWDIDAQREIRPLSYSTVDTRRGTRYIALVW
jgi:hypothetical protein